MNPVQDIPLGKLAVWGGNVRQTGAETGLDELAASIAAHGLLNPLTVRKAAKGRFEVVAGQRRLLALRQLAGSGLWPKTDPVPCSVIEDGRDAVELSLAENVVRLAMHPADQFTAWQGLAAQGASADDIAARFGVTAQTVRRRMALGRVSPKLLDLYRRGDLSLEALQAYTLTDDHARQETAHAGLGYSANSPHSVRSALTEAEIPTRDKRVRFVTLAAYEAAGGTVRRDLFAEDGGGTCRDEALLDRLVREKLDAVAVEVKTEGWLWTEVRPSFGWDERQDYEQAEPVHDEAQPDENGDPVEVWPDDVRAVAGAVISLGYGGAVEIERGLIRPDDLPDSGDGDGETGGDEPTAQPDAAPALSASLVEDLTAHRTAALRAELAQSPSVALALVVYTLAAPMFAYGRSGLLKADLRSRALSHSVQDREAPAFAALDASREQWADRLPGDDEGLWEWCFAAEQSDLLDLLAVVAAHGLDAVASKQDPNAAARKQGAALAATLGMDMAQWWTPTASGYFGRVPKALILSDLEAARQAPTAPSWAKLPKKELAALAEREVAGTGWLPEPLR